MVLDKSSVRSKMSNINQIVEMNLQDLKILILSQSNDDLINNDSIEIMYANVLIAYYENNLDKLKKINAKIKSQNLSLQDVEKDWLNKILNLREFLLDYKKINFEEVSIEQSTLNHSINNKSIFQAEYLFLQAKLYERKNLFKISSDFYKRASQAYESLSPKKELKSLLNQIAMLSRLNINNHYILEYQSVAEKAQKISDGITYGLCLNNISREYQRMGAYRTALETINKAIEYLIKDFGSLHYYEALTNKIHYSLRLGLINQAKTDFEILKQANFEKIQNDILALEMTFQDEKYNANPLKTSMSWIDRLQNKEYQSQLSVLTPSEEKLIEYISTRSLKKSELIDFFSNDESDYTSKDNRLKNLISRIRKKRPGLINYDGTFYSISVSFLEKDFISTKKIV